MHTLLHTMTRPGLSAARVALSFFIGLCAVPHAVKANESADPVTGISSAAASAAALIPPMLAKWRTIVERNIGGTEDAKISAVNDFFNQFDYAEDERLWGTQDYWATPAEVLTAQAGDCEDMSIAKYFTLRRLGIPAERLRLTYVKVPSLNIAHMVLSYYETSSPDPLVLDTMVPDIERASSRTDLEPVYSFDAESLWIALTRNQHVRAGNAKDLIAWRALLGRLAAQEGSFSLMGDI